MPAIETRALRKVFPPSVEAVAGIDLAVLDGEIFGFLGPNGAGKTTTGCWPPSRPVSAARP